MKDEQVKEIAEAIRVIAHGGLSGPTGLEALAMSLAGEGPYSFKNVAAALGHIATAIDDLTDAYRERTHVLQKANKE